MDSEATESLDPRAGQSPAYPFDEVVGRMLRAHPSASSEAIAALLASAMQATADARVHQFRLLLAERRVRRALAARSEIVPRGLGQVA